MRYKIHDKKYNYSYYFDTNTGSYLRTGILDEKGKDTAIDPFMGNFPHLIDIGIMGHCIHGKTGLCVKAGVECYQDGLNIEKPNMTLDNFRWILKQCEMKTNQVALGGRGDPDQHEDFEEILKTCREYGVVPSYTTSGLGITDKIASISKKYCGAVAVSWYRSEYTKKAIAVLLKHKIKTSIHYVLSNSSIEEAIYRLENNDFPKGITAIIFLLHKPKGLGSQKNVLQNNDERLKYFFHLADTVKFPFQIGFDSCTVPGINNNCTHIIKQSMEPCEGGRFSCYISSDMIMTPCSFDVENDYGVSLKNKSIFEVWHSDEFGVFRKNLKHRCPKCEIRIECMGGCPLMPEIVLCNKKERKLIKYEV